MKKISKDDIKRVKEKGKEWFEKNKSAIMFGAGCASSIAIAMIFSKYDKIKNMLDSVEKTINEHNGN